MMRYDTTMVKICKDNMIIIYIYIYLIIYNFTFVHAYTLEMYVCHINMFFLFNDFPFLLQELH